MAPIRWREIGTWSFWLRRLHPARHLTERETAAMAVEQETTADPVTASLAAHLAACPECAARRSEARVVLDRFANAAESAFDAEMPPHRLARQRRRVLRRIEGVLGQRTARILRFPVTDRPTVRQASRAARWFGATAAAGLLVAMVLVQPGDAPRSASDVAPPGAETLATVPALELASETPPALMTDEQLMRDLETALATRRVEPLMALDELTPQIRAALTDIR
ncbi:MAG: hypothetical protein F4Y45_09300 [Acidobacteria bacterium]|nr:hypothetical protein [Acidobacteriota bacterium]MYD69941.1 hypothetical protein [Acidobacteriota bacterium]MYJ05334.1 hypothetical protein [Acidobacteriota bacterium]